MKKIILISTVMVIALCCRKGYSQTPSSKKVQISSDYYKNFEKSYPNFSIDNFESLTVTKKADSTIILAYKLRKGKLAKLPPAFPITINDVKVGATDSGKYPDAVAGDGIYTVVAKAESPQNFSKKAVYKIEPTKTVLVSPIAKESSGGVECTATVDCHGCSCITTFHCTITFSIGSISGDQIQH